MAAVWTRADRIRVAILYLLMAVMAVIIIFPIYWLVVTAIKPPVEWMNHPPIFIPTRLYLVTFSDLFSQSEVLRALRNNVVVGVFGTFFPLLLGSTVSYALSRVRFWFKRPMLIWILFNRMIPPVTLLIPYFVIMRNMGMIDTLTGLVVSRVFITFPFVTWMMVGFFQTIPTEIDQAAVIDGCNLFQRYWYIGVPLGKVGFATTGLFVFLTAWNELMFSMTIGSEKAQTLPVLIAGYIGANAMKWGPMTALSVISIVPVLAVALLAQRYLVAGLTLGSVKG